MATPNDFVLDRLEQHARAQPNKIVFSFLSPGFDGGKVQKSFTYYELSETTANVAEELVARGLKRGDRALLVYPPSLDFMVGFLACLKAGVVAVPVFPPNPSRRDTLQMFSNIAESSGARFALTSREYNHMKNLTRLKDTLSRINRPLQGSWPDNLTWIVTDGDKADRINSSWPKPHPRDLAFLQYTSGSTSEPKGVMITQGNLSHNLTIITAELKASHDTVVVSWLPQYHDMGLIGSYLGVIYCGGRGIYLSPLAFLQRPMLWMEAVSKYRATHLQAPNFAFKLTAQKFDPSNYVNRPLNFRSVRHIINAAEPVDEASILMFYKAFGPFGLANVIFPTYGLAEHTVFVCSGGKQVITVRKATLEVDGKVQIVDDVKEDETVSRLVGCGFPQNQNVDVRIVDPDTCQELPYDRVGEVWISSPSKAAGYFGKESDTFEMFNARIKMCTAAKVNESQYLRTGDTGFLHNDELFICGRLKDLIIVRGRNHFPQDIEATAEIVSTHFRPGCSAAFTIDPSCGDEKVALVMELRDVPPAHQAEKQCSILADEVRASINHVHSLGISQLVFLKPRTVPKTTSGKIARSWCRKGFLAETLQVVYQKSFNDNFMGVQQDHPDLPTSKDETKNDLRVQSQDDVIDKLRADVSRIGQVPPDAVDKTTALVTILDSLSLSQLKGLLEESYAISVSDDFLYDEGTTLLKLAEQVQQGTVVENDHHRDHSSAMLEGRTSAGGGLAASLGCPPGIVCCVVQ